MQIKQTKLSGFLIIEPDPIIDERGFFMEVYRTDTFAEHGIPTEFVQENHSSSSARVLRGLHFQWEPKLGKLIRVIRGKAFAVAVDIRPDSPTLGQWSGIELSYENKKQVWAPSGFATGFCVIGKNADMEYHYTALYNSKGESNILWNDPKIDIDWPIENPIVSPRDSNAQTLEEWLKHPEAHLF
jgi:dTDP-4-dehydrorhamnose 3,5-epimerase